MNRKAVSELLMEAGMSPSLRGFDYILDAMELIDGDRGFLYSVTRLLYPAIAEKHGSTPSKNRTLHKIRHQHFFQLCRSRYT